MNNILYKIMRIVKSKDSITFDLYNAELKINFELKFCCCLRTTYYYQVYKYYENSYSVTDIEFHEMDYNKKFPINDINEEDMIIIVDFSIEPSEMLDLLRINKNVIWIDHHITAINKYDEWMSLIKEATGVDRIEGLRYNGLAGCELTWLFYNGYFKDESEIYLDKALYIL